MILGFILLPLLMQTVFSQEGNISLQQDYQFEGVLLHTSGPVSINLV